MMHASKLTSNIYYDTIMGVNKKIMSAIFSKISDANREHQNKILCELPYYFECFYELVEKGIVSMVNLRILIWGHVIECLQKNDYNVDIDIQHSSEKCFIFIKWKTSLDVLTEKLSHYTSLITKHSINSD